MHIQSARISLADGYLDTPSSSQTYQYVSGGFINQYTDGTGVSGAWVTDNLVIGGTTVTGLQFGVAYYSTIPSK